MSLNLSFGGGLVTKSCSTLVILRTVARQAPLSMGFFQARMLEWVAISFSRGSSQPRDWTLVSYIATRFFTDWATREALNVLFTSPLIEKAIRDLNSAAGDLQVLLSHVKSTAWIFSLSSWKNWTGYKNKLPNGLAHGKQKHPIIG